jgi:hypothetical protein
MVAKYYQEDCDAAIRGEKIPQNFGSPPMRQCLIRGIRYHHGFATELQGHAKLKDVNRALNARSIMSNVIPETMASYDIPYCIWHPEVASEDTYRQLAERYPQMQYQVGRACTVAGYVALYKELNLLPDVHIAEEARDNGSTEIYGLIMAHDVKYDIMNDYERTLQSDEKNLRRAHLNGDTAVRSLLEIKQAHSREGLKKQYFDITEDMNVDQYTTQLPRPAKEDVTPLLYAPLPDDLPTVNKDLLILMAAYYGNIDRYVKLRRPVMIDHELQCIVRGIFHNTMFAKWSSLPGNHGNKRLDGPSRYSIEKAITARYIMNNDLSRIATENVDVPDCIWYPTLAQPSTYKKLVDLKPSMIKTVVQACIVADYEHVYKQLPDFDPDPVLISEAKDSSNPFYLEDLNRRVAEKGIDLENIYVEAWKVHATQKQLLQKSGMFLWKVVTEHNVSTGPEAIYNGILCEAGNIEVNVCASDALKAQIENYEWISDLHGPESAPEYVRQRILAQRHQ